MNKEYQSSFLVNTKPTPRVSVFINSGNDHMIQNQVIDNSQLIKLPFPPEINSRDLVILHPDGRIPKPPNAFIIYRKLFVETTRTSGYNLPMNIISSMVSQSWEQESNEVKNEYKRIAKEAFNYWNELFPKMKIEKKRNQWKMVSFDKPSTRKVRMPKPMKSTNKSIKKSIKNKQLESPTVEPEFNLLPEITGANNLNSENLNLDLFADWADFFDSQNVYPSPDLSTISSDYSPNMIEEFEFDLESSAQCFDLPNQQNQQNQVNKDIINDFLFTDDQTPINGNQYGFGVFDFSNENLGTIQMFNTQNMFNIVDEISYDQLLNTTINQDYLNDNLISYEMAFDHSF
ncbi:37291_t:CDS:1 [Gigaspora margarita]|uniref:37291_t:CDS:1 n=1 Tax=Gigaspora margarita TaxID=4874 RepID=A0ABN7V2N8_GIGMA|nr:37291_t:CDS:1 [Gigaspora margarita]